LARFRLKTSAPRYDGRLLRRLLKIWTWSVRVYAAMCVAAMIAVMAFRAKYPQQRGIPGWLFIFVQLPAVGLELLPVIFLIDVVLAIKRIYEKRAAIVQLIIVLIGWCFCLQGLR